MELHQLAYLVAVAEEGSFTRAAQRVHVSQPGVSAQVAKLEQELGTPLLERRTRSVVLTDAGRAVLVHAREALAAVEAARERVAELQGLVRGRVAVGHLTSGTSGAGLLAAFHARHPEVEIRLVEAASAELVAQVLDGGLDLAWVGLSGPRPAGLGGVVLRDDAVVLAVSPDHPLAARSRVRVADLDGLDLLALPPGTGSRAALDAVADVRVALEVGSPELLGELAARGLGPAVLPEPLAVHLGLRVVAIVGPVPRSRLELVWRTAGPSGAAGRALLAMAGERAAAGQDD